MSSLALIQRVRGLRKLRETLRPKPSTKRGAKPIRRVSKADLERWHDNPVLYAREALGIEVWGRQADILRAVAQHPRVAVRSGHKVGKSTSAVILALWWVTTRERARVIMTSSTGRQVRAILWKELRRVYAGSALPVGGTLHKVPDAGLQYEDGREVVGFSTNEPEKMAGFSGPNILFILDEASGIPAEIFEAIEGNRAGGARLVMFSNPTQVVGEFYEAFHAKRHLYHCLRVSSAETPNARGDGPPIPGLATKSWLDEKREEWGEDSPIYAVRVEGEFPRTGTNNVVSIALIEQAVERWRSLKSEDLDDEARYKLPAPDDDALHLGVDVGREGDDPSVICPRRGFEVLPLREFRGLDGPDLAGKVLETAIELRRPGERVVVKVDVIGVGSSCYDALRRLVKEPGREWLEVVPINVSEAATVAPKKGDPGFCNLRSQMWFGMADWLKAGGVLPEDGKLHGELAAPTYAFDLRGRRQVEGKRETKKRLGRSTDRADAFGLSLLAAKRASSVEAPPVIENDFSGVGVGFG